MKQSEQKCENCRFFKRAFPDSGLCFRYPPQIVVCDGKSGSEYTEVYLTGWCGEWQEKAK